MRMVQWKSGCDYYLLSYEYFYLANLPSKLSLKGAFHRSNWNAAAGQQRHRRHLKLLGIKVLIKHFKESGLTPETMLRTERSRPFLKLQKLLIFGILAKGGPHEDFLESFNSTNG